MKLEVGKKYRSDVNTIYTVIHKEGALFVGYKDASNIFTFTENGRPGGEHGVNLIEECTEPIKYSVEVWLEGSPFPHSNTGVFATYVLGGNVCWNPVKRNNSHRKYKITVEEVV